MTKTSHMTKGSDINIINTNNITFHYKHKTWIFVGELVDYIYHSAKQVLILSTLKGDERESQSPWDLNSEGNTVKYFVRCTN